MPNPARIKSVDVDGPVVVVAGFGGTTPPEGDSAFVSEVPPNIDASGPKRLARLGVAAGGAVSVLAGRPVALTAVPALPPGV